MISPSLRVDSASIKMRKRVNRRHWLSPSLWELIQATVPVVCVDVLPIRISPRVPNRVEAIGLILRETPHQGQRWCLIGGRVLFGESLRKAVLRQVKETLGTHVRVYIRHDQQPVYLAEYSPNGTRPFALDPRKHAVGLTYAVRIAGSPSPRGEAISYQWFKTNKLPRSKEFGFDQDRVVYASLRLIRNRLAGKRLGF